MLEKDIDNKVAQLYPTRKTIAEVPTNHPKNEKEQIELYKNGATYRMYCYMDGDWYYTNLTKV